MGADGSIEAFAPSGHTGYPVTTWTSDYGGNAQCWIGVDSEDGRQREEQTLQRRIAQEFEGAHTQWRRLLAREFGRVAGARAATDTLGGRWKYHRV